MKKMLLIAVAMIFVAGIASAASIVDSAHDMRTHISNETTTQVCVFCHTPHQPTGRTTKPLWNHSLSTVASYGIYTSPTMSASPVDIGNTSVAAVLCMGCHDGTVAVNSLWKNPTDGTAGTLPRLTGGGYTQILNASMQIASTSGGYIGTDLTNDHPINFTYTTGDPGIRAAGSISVPLFNGTVQCSSCHNVHDPANTPFLRISNAASALYLNCHIK